MTPEDKYPALMAYIRERSSHGENTAWSMLRADEAAAVQGGFAEVAKQLKDAQTEYAAAEIDKERSGYPYNSDMGIFLGLPLRSNHEPASPVAQSLVASAPRWERFYDNVPYQTAMAHHTFRGFKTIFP
ncbi:hypothetical protein [Acidicapsa ligni]|uniref:hypothetical protein n=1 Tax=Acidicapsa ligni TaxID=542300 RepID=UPI0021E0A3AE|nr:hypothetical protein [Acidicapsa ligni]